MAQPLITSNQVEFPSPLQACRVATTAAITLSGLLTVDGVALVAGNRVLVKNGSTANPGTTSVDNGVYLAAAGAWARSPDFDGSPTDETKQGDWVFITDGTANATSNWTIATPNPIVIGSTPITFFQSSGGSGNFLPLTGGTMTGTINMSTNKITNLGTPTVASDAATKTYVDGLVGGGPFVPLSGGTMTGSLTAPAVLTGDGSTASPSHTFSTSTGTGMSRHSSGALDFSIAGVQCARVQSTGVSIPGNLFVNTNNTSGGGVVLSDDGDIVDLNTGYCAMRFTSGVQIYSTNGGGSAVITLAASGIGTATNWIATSDKRLKTNIRELPIDRAIHFVLNVEGKLFNKNGEPDIGFIAQEVLPHFPEIVKEDSTGMLGLNYGAITAIHQQVLRYLLTDKLMQQEGK